MDVVLFTDVNVLWYNKGLVEVEAVALSLPELLFVITALIPPCVWAGICNVLSVNDPPVVVISGDNKVDVESAPNGNLDLKSGTKNETPSVPPYVVKITLYKIG